MPRTAKTSACLPTPEELYQFANSPPVGLPGDQILKVTVYDYPPKRSESALSSPIISASKNPKMDNSNCTFQAHSSPLPVAYITKHQYTNTYYLYRYKNGKATLQKESDNPLDFDKLIDKWRNST